MMPHRQEPNVIIRTPLPSDLSGILEVIKQCAPYLTVHSSYVFWMEIHNFADTCVVAEHDGEIVGWCSILRVGRHKLFLHQLGVASSWRGKGVAERMAKVVLNKFSEKSGRFELQFTMDRKNKAVLRIFRSVLRELRLEIVATVKVADLAEPGCDEDLYSFAVPATAMVGQAGRGVYE